jgi:hypothetical protein
VKPASRQALISHSFEPGYGDHTIDTIQIAVGTYFETVIPPRDGLAYIGERDLRAQPIIDPSTLVSNTWTSELLAGIMVWKIKLGYEPGIFTYNGKCIECVGQGLMSKDLTGASPRPWLSRLRHNDWTAIVQSISFQTSIAFFCLDHFLRRCTSE